MAIESREIEVVICDACMAEEIVPTRGLPVGWFSGDAVQHNENGGRGGDWYACKPAHIKKAVMLITGAEEG